MSTTPTVVIERLFSVRNVPPPRTYAPLRTQEDAVLRRQLEGILGAQATDFSIVVKDLQTGRGTALNADQEYYAASLFKLWVMYEVMHQESLGILRPSLQLTVSPYYDAFGLGPRQTSLCQKLTLTEALEAMMAISDNAAAIMLMDLAGTNNINAALGAFGLKVSEITQDETLPTTAADVALLLEAIGRFQALDRERSQEMLRLLTLEQFDNGLRAGVPRDALVAHKTGNWQGVTHDAGVIVTPRASYVLVILSAAGNAPAKIKEISTAVYEHFTQGRTP